MPPPGTSHATAGEPSPGECGRCRYDLRGLADRAGMVVCPECGLEQPRRIVPPPWPRGWREVAWQCGVTLALCNLCLLLLLLLDFSVAFGGPLLWLAALTFLSGPVVPIATGCVLSRGREAEGIHEFIVMGWLWNLLIGVGYLFTAVAVGRLLL